MSERELREGGLDVIRETVFDAIDEERKFQDRKHGSIDEHPHTIGGWLLLIESELEEAKLAAIKGGTGRNAVMQEILQIAATATAAIEQHGLDEETRRPV
jgi:hypothetical protein